MIICLCEGISEDVIIECIESGYDTLDKITQETCVSVECGHCKADIVDIINQYKKQKDNEG